MTDPEVVINTFEQRWRSGTPPDLADFLLSLAAPSDELLYELVVVDIEYRWRQYATTSHDWLGGDAPPLLEEYLKRFATLRLDAELLGEEYRARLVWGDKPSVADYKQRFPALAAEFSRVAATLADEVETEVPRGTLAVPVLRTDSVPEVAEELELGPYRFAGRLGSGATGFVYKATHQATGQTVAVKVLRLELLGDRDTVARFEREARLLTGLTHPNLVRLLGIERSGPRVGLVMELVEGDTLTAQIQKQGPLSIDVAFSLARDLLTGLAFIHQGGLVHRDITPGNLMRGTDGRLRILDLGLAKLRAEATQTGSPIRSHSSWLTPQGVGLVGTPDYMAPELARDASAASPGSDLYSAGCVVYFVLTGQSPYPGGAAFDKLLRHTLAPVPEVQAFRNDVPAGLVNLVASLLAKQPHDRPATALAALRLLEP